MTESIANPPLDFIRQHAQEVLKASPIEYVATAAVKGSLFNKDDSTGLICGADSNFFVDHTEPDQALHHVKSHRGWPLGNLPEGHEFLLVFPAKPRQSAMPLSRE